MISMPSARSPATFTTGYAGKSLDTFMTELLGAEVDRVIDVRALPLSRRKGFSKTQLSEALAARGIEYIHLREAGNPFRDQKGDLDECLRLYARHLDASPEIIVNIEAALAGHRAALLCYEADARECHRSIIVSRLLARDPERPIHHL